MAEIISPIREAMLILERLELMGGTIYTLIVKHIKRGLDMTQTLEEFKESMRQRGRELMIPTPEDIVKAFSAEEIFRVFPAEERLRGLSAEEVFRAFSPEEIRAYLKKLPKKSAPARKKGTKSKKSAKSGNSAPHKKVLDNPPVLYYSP